MRIEGIACQGCGEIYSPDWITGGHCEPCLDLAPHADDPDLPPEFDLGGEG